MHENNISTFYEQLFLKMLVNSYLASKLLLTGVFNWKISIVLI